MMRPTVITPKQAENYYRKENYYSKEQSKQNSEWFNRGAERLELVGEVEAEDFSKLIHGKLPNGEKFRNRPPTHAKYKERAGLDLTFSAPKSFSIALLVNRDERLEIAQQEAVKVAMNVVEERYASTRIRENGERRVVKTGNLVAALIHHDASREKDPQRHTHAVLLNMTEYEGQWYSLRNDDILSKQKLISQIYQNELAYRVKQLGYEIEQRESGHFEIKGYTPEQIEYFSKRRGQIVAAVGADASAKEREYAALKTRKPKGAEIPREELQEYWRLEGKAIGLQHPTPRFTQSSGQKLNKIVDEAIAHCSERNVNFNRESIEKFIFNELGQASWNDIQKSIDQNQNLLKAKDNEYTTLSAVNRELDTIRMVNRGKGSAKAITSGKQVQERLKEKSFTEGQHQAILDAVTTRDHVVAWQGKAGVGKTYALNEYKQIAEEQGYTIKGFAPSAAAAGVLGSELGIESNTVAQLLNSKSPQERSREQLQWVEKNLKGNARFEVSERITKIHHWEEECRRRDLLKEIWIIDEAGLLSAKDTHALLKKAEAEKVRILFVGDAIRQLSAVEAGNPFKSLQKAGMTTSYLNESMRQKDEGLKQAVDAISDGEIAKGVQLLDAQGRIEEVRDPDKRAEKIADDYMTLSEKERDKTLILAGTNQEREAITSQIRERLRQEGKLGQDYQAIQLKAKDLSSIQMKYAHHYEKGDVVVAHRNYKKLGLEKGKLYKVNGKDGERVILQADDGQKLTVNPMQFDSKTVYEQKEFNLAVGDRLKWKKNDRKLGRTNGQEVVIADINVSMATLEYTGGKKEIIDLREAQHLDHAIVSTTYSSQGKTADRVLVSATSDRTLSSESFYVAASRAKYDVHIYAQNKEKLLEKAQQSRANQNALEVLDEQHQQVRRKVNRGLGKIFTEYVKTQRLDKILTDDKEIQRPRDAGKEPSQEHQHQLKQVKGMRR